jgi:negative regulator of sigma E activity
MDQLIQRFVDQELPAEERVRFIARLGHDAVLRQQVLELEELLLDTSRLTQPAVPNDFVAGVMARIEAVPMSQPVLPLWQRLVGALLAPRVLQWNLASAGAVACVALAAVVWTGKASLQPSGNAPSTSPVAVAAPPGATTVLVRFVVLRPGAASVQVAGDFNGWNPAQTSLAPAANGAWTVTLPLAPGRYEYMFVVDGQEWIVDPFALEQADDGFGSKNAVIDVRTEAAQAL